MVRGWLTGLLGVRGLLALLLVARLADAKGGPGGHGGHCGHAAHSGGHPHGGVPHVSHGTSHPSPWHPPATDERQVWHCGFFPVLLGMSPVTVQRNCGAPETTRQTVYGDDRGEHVIDVWSYQPRDAQVRILKFENGALISVVPVGPAR